MVYWHFPLAHNQSNFHYFGLVVKQGGLPYQDFVDRRGPVGLYVYAIPQLVFGKSEVYYRIWDWLIMLLIGYVIFKLCLAKKYVLISLITASIWLVASIAEGPGNTGDVTNLLVLFISLSAFILIKKPDKVGLFITGILIGLSFWVKPTSIAVFSIPLLYLLISKKLQTRLILNLGFGFIVIFLLGLIYLSSFGLLNKYYEIIYIDPINCYTSTSLADRFSLHTFKSILGWVKDHPVFSIAGLAGLTLAVRKKAHQAFLTMLFLIGALCMILIEAKFYPYHFSIGTPFLALGIHQLLEYTFQKKQYIFLLLLLLLQIKTFYHILIPHFSNSDNEISDARYFQEEELKEQYIRRRLLGKELNKEVKLNSKEPFFLLGSNCGIYNQLDIKPSSRFAFSGRMLFYDNYLDLPWHRQHWHQEIKKYMTTAKPDRIAIDSSLHKKIGSPYAVINEIKSLLEKNYVNEKVVAGYFVYKNTSVQ